MLTRLQMLSILALAFLNVAVLGTMALLFGSPPTARTPAPTPITPTTVAEAATETPTVIPARPTPTATLVNAEPRPTTEAAGAIMEAINKGKTAKSYRVEMGMSMKGDFGQSSAGESKNQEVLLFSMSGEVSGGDSHLIMKGIVGAMFSGDPSKGVEMTSLAGKSYVKGPAPLLAAKDNRWYVLTASDAASTKSKLGSADMYSSFLSKDQDLSVFEPAGTETLDGLKCGVYSANKQDALNALLSMGATSEIGQNEWSLIQSNIQASEYKIWVCGDGYLHQMRINLQVQDERQPQQVLGMKLLLHAYDFGSNIKITAPANAVPAVSPFIQTEVPTPSD